MSLLGHLAEALLVSRCNQYQDKNRLWGRYARQTKHSTGASVEILDQYVAIGTGLYLTQVNYRTKYNPNDTQRDIIWVSKDDPNTELAKTGSHSSGHRPAGLQLKVSLDGNYVLNQLKRKKEYEVPVVYFDLNRDFEWVAEKLGRETEAFDATRWTIGVNLICGRLVDQELHDTLLHFLPLLEQLLDGRLKLSDLSETPEVSTAITRQLLKIKKNK
jgi:hypothetical protein